MKKTLIILISLFALAACQTAGQPKPTPSEIAAKVCPALEATIAVLQYSPAISEGAKEEIEKGAPMVRAVCTPGLLADVPSLLDLADRLLPTIMRAVSESTMKDGDKQNILLAIALIQISLNTVKYDVD